jgi:hypothetical protein
MHARAVGKVEEKEPLQLLTGQLGAKPSVQLDLLGS